MDLTLNLHNEEREFIQACINGERWAQKKLYEMHYPKMMGVCMRYAKNREDARDILHEGFIKVFKNLRKYKTGTSFEAWMRRIMVNTAIDDFRKKVRRRTDDIDDAHGLSSDAPSADSQVNAKEILDAIALLSPAYRTVFNLYAVEGFSHKEIAERLGITESTSRSNLVKARGKLKAMLAAKYSEYGQ